MEVEKQRPLPGRLVPLQDSVYPVVIQVARQREVLPGIVTRRPAAWCLLLSGQENSVIYVVSPSRKSVRKVDDEALIAKSENMIATVITN